MEQKEQKPVLLTRRELLKAGAAGLTGAGLLALLASCSPNERVKETVYGSQAHFTEIWVSDNASIHTEDGSPFNSGAMLKATYDPNNDSVISLPQLDPNIIPSTPETGKRKVTNIYWNQDTNRLRVVYAKE